VKLENIDPNELLKRINLLLSDYLPEIYMYNNMIKHKKYYLKPVHIVVKTKSNGCKIKYYYYGRYWYRIEKKENGGRGIKWVYIGRDKPDNTLPDPPRNPLEGLVIKISDNEVTIISSSRETLKLINDVLTSYCKAHEASQAHI